MPEQPIPGRRTSADGDERFDGDRVRDILEHAAAEQCRLDHESTEAYSLEELEEMAAEAGISPAALQAAIARSGQPSNIAAIGASERERPSFRKNRWLGSRYRVVKGSALLGVAGVALVGSILAFPLVAQVLFWTTIVLSVLILLGASPF